MDDVILQLRKTITCFAVLASGELQKNIPNAQILSEDIDTALENEDQSSQFLLANRPLSCHQNNSTVTRDGSGKKLAAGTVKGKGRTNTACSNKQNKPESVYHEDSQGEDQQINTETDACCQGDKDSFPTAHSQRDQERHTRQYFLPKKRIKILRLKQGEYIQDKNGEPPSKVKQSAEMLCQESSSISDVVPSTASESFIEFVETVKVEADEINADNNMFDNDELEKYVCKLCGWVFCKNSYSKGFNSQPIPVGISCRKVNIIDQIKAVHDACEHAIEEKTTLTCSVCYNEYFESEDIIEHIIYEHSMQYTCEACNETLLTYSLIQKHMEDHIEKEKVKKENKQSSSSNHELQCSFCGITVLTKYNLQRHIKRYHQEKKFTCDICSKKFADKSAIDRHLKTHDMKFECDIENCGKKFSRETSLLIHKAKHESKKLICTVCGKICSCLSKLNHHMKYHGDDRTLKCPECGKAYKTKDVLTKHMRTHSATRHYYCEICGRGFDQSGTLQRHMIVHTDFKPHQCNVCGVQYRNLASLKTHKLRSNHYDEKENKTVVTLECKECGKQFLTSSGFEYKRHLLIHTGEKPFKCTVCNKAFNDKSNLRHHMKIHEDDRPFPCSVCEKRFIHQRSLRNHMNGHVNGTLQAKQTSLDGRNGQNLSLTQNTADESGPNNGPALKISKPNADGPVSSFDILNAAASHIEKWARETGADQLVDECEEPSVAPYEREEPAVTPSISLEAMQKPQVAPAINLEIIRKPEDQNCEILLNADSDGNIFISNAAFTPEDPMSGDIYLNKPSTSMPQFDVTDYNLSNIQVFCPTSVLEKWPGSVPSLTTMLHQNVDRYLNMEPVPLQPASTSEDSTITLKQYNGTSL